VLPQTLLQNPVVTGVNPCSHGISKPKSRSDFKSSVGYNIRLTQMTIEERQLQYEQIGGALMKSHPLTGIR